MDISDPPGTPPLPALSPGQSANQTPQVIVILIFNDFTHILMFVIVITTITMFSL